MRGHIALGESLGTDDLGREHVVTGIVMGASTVRGYAVTICENALDIGRTIPSIQCDSAWDYHEKLRAFSATQNRGAVNAMACKSKGKGKKGKK